MQHGSQFHVRIVLAFILLSLGRSVFAHDLWLETNAGVIRAGDTVFIDLKLGNHGNDHRDFKLAGKAKLNGSQVWIHLPNGQKYDFLTDLRDVGYAPNEGYWSGRFVGGAAGTFVISASDDNVLNHGRPVRSIKSAKTFYFSSSQLDRLKDETTRWKEPLGHALEIVPVSHPVLMTGPGMPIKIRVLLKGKPKANARVSFIPQGTTLAEGFDEQFERTTDEEGLASFTPRIGNRYLIVTHERNESEKTAEYDLTSYSATLQMIVPDVCPCCQ